MSDVIVIGGGPAGITAALAAASGGASVTLITADAIGGRATWASLLPSKVCLTAADHLDECQHFPALGLVGDPPHPDLPRLRDRIRTLAEKDSAQAREHLERAGVAIRTGRARFIDPHRIEILATGAGNKQEQSKDEPGATLDVDKAIIASGSVPVFPPAIKPDGRRIIAPRLIGAMAEWPRTMIVIGGGVTGAEFAYFFRRIGCDVTWITDLSRILPRYDEDLVEMLEASFKAQGGTIISATPVVAAAVDEGGDRVLVTLHDGQTIVGSHAFIALGRRADVDGLGCAAAGIAYGTHGIHVDSYGRTTEAHIYGVGDVAGPPYVANRGQAQAYVAGRHAAGVETEPFRPETVIEAVYARPQMAQLGLTEAAAAAEGRPVLVHRMSYDEALKCRLAAHTDGLIKLLSDPEDGRIVGAGAVGERAADLLLPVAVAMTGDLPIKALASLYPAYPTLGELVGLAARAAPER